VVDSGEAFSQLGQVFSLGLDGSYEAITLCRQLVDPTDVLLTETGSALVTDRAANPLGFPAGGSAVFHFDTVLVAGGPYCTTYLTGPPLVQPVAVDIRFQGTPVMLCELNASETAAGVRLCWTAPSVLDGADYYIYRCTPEIPPGDFDLLNPTAPVRGEGELSFLDPAVSGGCLYEYRLVATLVDGSHREFGPLTIRVQQGPGRFELSPVLPNPCLGAAGGEGITIRFSVPRQDGPIRLGLYDVSGRLIRRLIDEPLDPGNHVCLWNGRDSQGSPVSSGIFFLRLEAGARRDHRRIVLLR
jgi:hypothetical protein